VAWLPKVQSEAGLQIGVPWKPDLTLILLILNNAHNLNGHGISPRRGAGTTRPFGDFDASYGGWEIEGEPTQKYRH
jgi:hypothetical protein